MCTLNRQVDLDQARIDELIAVAKDASANAYCPYSNFRVGAAVLAASGKTYCGCNVENASYSETLCAERVAISSLVAAGEREILAIVVYTPTAAPTTPCGACRQVVHEFGADAQILCICDGPETIHLSAAELLPRAFGPRNLNR